MPAPRWLPRANKIGLNRLTRFGSPPWAPGWGVVIHRGRSSGRTFRTPLWGLQTAARLRDRADLRFSGGLVRNVLAAGGCELETPAPSASPSPHRVVYRDESASGMPIFIRFMLRRVIKAPEFLSLDTAGEAPRTPQ